MTSLLVFFIGVFIANFILLKITCNKLKPLKKSRKTKQVTKIRSITTSQLSTNELSSTGS